jgi:hypothetical protein
LGLGRLYTCASDARATEHLLIATRMLTAMDMPHWLHDAAAAQRDS